MKNLVETLKRVEDPAALLSYASVLFFADLFMWMWFGFGLLRVGEIPPAELIGAAAVGVLMFRYSVAMFLPMCHKLLVESGIRALNSLFRSGFRPADIALDILSGLTKGLTIKTPAMSHRAFSVTAIVAASYVCLPEQGLVAELLARSDSLPGPVHFLAYLSLVAIAWTGLMPTKENEREPTVAE